MKERLLVLDGTFNCRDLGGYQTAEGRKTKWGKLFRADALHQLTTQDLARLEEIGLKTVVDFRSPSEAAIHPDILPQGAELVVLAPHAWVAAEASKSKSDEDAARVGSLVQRASTPEGREWMQRNLDTMEGQMRKFVTEESGIDAFGKFMALVARPDSAPLLFHCKGGKDRTGWGAALILMALDVPRQTIMEDYMATALFNQERNEKRMDEYRQLTDNAVVLEFMSSLMRVKESYMQAAFEEVDKMGGTHKYLAEVLNFSPADTERLKALYLE